ncbi:hypothetical protein ACXYMO_01125 [Arenibacterium sp. CAU 1754]
MTAIYPILSDIWPYSEAAVPPELASLPVDFFFTDPKGSGVTAAQWVTPVDPAAAPRASYALRVSRAGGRGELARWDPTRGDWTRVKTFPVPDDDPACAIIELHGILLGNVQDVDMLAARLKHLLSSELTEMKAYRITSKVLSVMSVIILFFAVRSGVESAAIEPFALIFAIAFGVGLIAVGLRTRCKLLSDQGLARLREQFQFEYRKDLHAPLSLNHLSNLVKEHDRKREEEAVIFGFLLLMCFVYFISPLVVIGVVVALIVVTLITGDPGMLRILGVAYDRSETRLEQSFLSFRAANDALAPPALRTAKKQVLRDRIRRYADMMGRVRDTQGRFRLTQDIAVAVAFLIIFSAYAFPIAAGLQKLAVSKADSLVTTSLFRVAPVIILLSISKSTVALAQIVNRKIVALSR